MRYIHRYSPPCQSGFTLIEALITSVILSIGLLGVAALQYSGLKNNNRSIERSLATILAYDITDRIRSNMPAGESGDYLVDPDNPPAKPAISSGSDPRDYCLTDFTATSRNGLCNSEELAAADIFNWFSTVQDTLPGGLGRITCADADSTDMTSCSAGSIYTITIMWDDARKNVSGTGCDPADEDDLLCFSLVTAI